jgi:hypothetical protein
MLLHQVASYIGYASSAFILLPAGRDIVSYKTCILPGEDKTRPLMTPINAKARTFMWGVWGLNHCALSILKCMAIYNADKPLLKFVGVTAAITFGYLIKEKKSFDEAGGDINGFIVVCGLQCLALGYLAFA